MSSFGHTHHRVERVDGIPHFQTISLQPAGNVLRLGSEPYLPSSAGAE